MAKSNLFLVAGTAVSMAAPVAQAARTAPPVPKPPVVTYGLIRDEYGVPLADDAKAVARLVHDAEPEGTV